MRPGTPPPADEPNLDELSDGEVLRFHDQWAEYMGFYGEDPYDPYKECSPTRRNDELPDIDLFEGYTGPPPLITRADDMYEARTPTVSRPYTVGLPLTRLAQEPTLDQDEDEVDDLLTPMDLQGLILTLVEGLQ